MSTILKALRRLEQEKSAQSDRPLSEAIANTPAPPPATRSVSPWLVAGGSLVLAFAVTVGVFWLLSADEAAPPAETVASAQAPRAAEPYGKPGATRPAPERPEVAARWEAAQRAKAARAKRKAELAEGALPAAALASEVEVVARAPKLPVPAPESETPPPVLELPRQGPRRPGLAALRPDVTGIVNSPVSPSGALNTPPEIATPSAAEIEEMAAARAAAAAPATRPVPEVVVAAREPAPKPNLQQTAPEPPQTAAAEVATTPNATRAPVPEVVAAVVEPRTREATALPRRPGAKPVTPVSVAEEPTPAPIVAKRKAAPQPVSGTPDPDIFVASTVWHPIADRRVAVVELGGNGESVEIREGDMIGPLVVGEIEPSGVYFTNNGVELRRRVGAR